MTKGGISKLEAAQRQLDCAIHLLQEGEDPLVVHTLAYAAYWILRDLCGPSQRREVLRQLEKSQQLGKVPNYLKHADKRPHAILKKHSDKHTYITLALAIRLWKERGQPETTEMRAFSELPDPFKPGHKASETLKFVQHGPIADPRAAQSHLDGLLTATSTGEAIITEK